MSVWTPVFLLTAHENTLAPPAAQDDWMPLCSLQFFDGVSTSDEDVYKSL